MSTAETPVAGPRPACFPPDPQLAPLLAPLLARGGWFGYSPPALAGFYIYRETIYRAAAIGRRGARVVEWGGLENRCAFAGTVGSNPTLSAST